MLPTVDQLEDLRRLLLDYAFDKKAKLQRDAVSYIFDRLIAGGQDQVITPVNIIELRPAQEQEKLADIHNAAYGLIREIGATFDAFYEGIPGKKPPHTKSAEAQFRPRFPHRGNYVMDCEEWKPRRAEPDFIRAFWKPHIAPEGVARMLYPEPIFLRDSQGTYLRNAEMGPEGNKGRLDYLGEGITKDLTPAGYSYVPAGIVRGLMALGKALRRFNRQQQSEDYFTFDVVKPTATSDTTDKDLILLATATSTKLVQEFQDGLVLAVDGSGVHEAYKAEPYNDSPRVKWGVCTRTRLNFRVVTMLSAKHGRSIEAMTRFLTLDKELAPLARWMQCTFDFPQKFQILFRIHVSGTDEEAFKEVEIHTVYIDGKRIDPA